MTVVMKAPHPAPLLFAVLLAACGNSSGPGTPVLSVGGSYTTAVSLQSSTCASPTIMTFATQVNHAPGASTLSLVHAGTTYNGSVDSSAHFTTTPRTVGGTYTIAIEGDFTTTAMDALVTVTDNSHACSYVVRWAGPKQGSPNVIP